MSDEVVTTTKTGRTRRVKVAFRTAELWQSSVATWQQRVPGDGEVTLHRLRHTVATVLVEHGKLLRAQQRLGHRDASTTLPQYCHALTQEDTEVADLLEAVYAGPAA